jgi:hypothetical protein
MMTLIADQHIKPDMHLHHVQLAALFSCSLQYSYFDTFLECLMAKKIQVHKMFTLECQVMSETILLSYNEPVKGKTSI